MGTTERKCLELIGQRPGLQAKDLPMAYRRHLRALEVAGKIVCRDYGWYRR